MRFYSNLSSRSPLKVSSQISRWLRGWVARLLRRPEEAWGILLAESLESDKPQDSLHRFAWSARPVHEVRRVPLRLGIWAVYKASEDYAKSSDALSFEQLKSTLIGEIGEREMKLKKNWFSSRIKKRNLSKNCLRSFRARTGSRKIVWQLSVIMNRFKLMIKLFWWCLEV